MFENPDGEPHRRTEGDVAVRISRPVPTAAGRFCCALQNARLLDHAREIRNRLFVDDRPFRLSRLPDLRQVTPGQDCQKAGAIPQSKRRHHELAMVGARPWTEIQYRGFRVPTVPVYGFTLPVAL